MRIARRLILLCCVPILSIGAQGALAGTVRDSAGRALAGAEVAIAALQKSTTSDDSGKYSLVGLPPGLRQVQVRRVGYSPVSKMVPVSASGSTADFVLTELVTKLDTVRRTEQYKPTDIQMMEFLDNKKIGLGKFFTRDDLEKMNGRPLPEAFMQLPGLLVITGTLGGSRAWIASSRVRSLNMPIVMLEDFSCGIAGAPNSSKPCDLNDNTSPVRDAWRTRCFPDVYLDFTLLSRHEVPNVNRFLTTQLEAVEVYSSPAELPARYISSTSQCGVVVLHNRRDGGK